MRRVVMAAICLVLAAAPTLAQSKAAIQKLNDEWAAAFNKGDAAALAGMYTSDAYVLPAGEGMVKGRVVASRASGAARCSSSATSRLQPWT